MYHLNDDAEGKPWNTAGVFVPLTGDAESMREVGSQLTFIPGTRHAQSAHITLQRFAGGVAEITMRPRFHWYMKGVGYGHPGVWPRGRYHGGPAQLFEEYSLSQVDDAMNLHIQAICDVSMEGLGARQGKGVLEQLILGPHTPSGFTELLDMAP